MGKDLFKKWWRNYWPLIGYFLISIIFLFPLLIQNGVPFKYDWFWPPFDMLAYWRAITDISNIGFISFLGKGANLFFVLFGWLRISPSLALKIFLLLVHTIAGYGFYLLVSKRTSSTLIAFVTGIAYAFSPYIFIRTIVGFVYSLIAYAFLPLFLNLYLNREKKRILDFFLLGLLLSLIFSQIQAGILLLLVMIILTFSQREMWLWRIREMILIIVFLLLITSPWALLFLQNHVDLSVVNGNAATTLVYISLVHNILRNMLMLSDHQITSEFFYTLSHNQLFLIGWALIWLVALLSFFNRRNRWLACALFVAISLTLPFVKGPTGLFAGFYAWFFRHFPQIAVFRETYHFEFLYSIVLCTTFALGLDWLYFKIKNREKTLSQGKHLLLAIKTLSLVLVLFIIAPYLTFDYADYLRLQPIPSAYKEFNNFLQSNKDYCQKIYYPPGLGFLYFWSDTTVNAANSDTFAYFSGVNYLKDGTTFSYLPSEEGFFRNQVVSQFYESEDNGEFAALLIEGNIDCVVVRKDLGTKYWLASNLWREKEINVYRKWMNVDYLNLALKKKGLEIDKQFADNIYLFKINQDFRNFDAVEFLNSKKQQLISLPPEKMYQDRAVINLPLVDWAIDAIYYQDGWSRGRYDFWRKHLFTLLRQDFVYTNNSGAEISGKTTTDGFYKLVIRYLDGGEPGMMELVIGDNVFNVEKQTGQERFVTKVLGNVKIQKGDRVKIKNISGENAIANLALIEN